jgi:flavin reductase (DIM6/NTAB) family NADH-FMN oxidoreductase RutF
MARLNRDRHMQPTAADLNEIDAAFRLMDHEIWIITAADGDRRGGLLATWVTAASIDRQRPVLLAGIAPNHFTAELVQASRAFAAHLLRPDQVELAWNFARDSGRIRDKLAGLMVASGHTGSPILADCLASFDCRVFARYSAGDRLFFWGDVVGALRAPLPESKSLREQQFFSNLAPWQRQLLAANRDADAACGSPLHETWRNTNLW